LKKHYLTLSLFGLVLLVLFQNSKQSDTYFSTYQQKLSAFQNRQADLLNTINKSNLSKTQEIELIKNQLSEVRTDLKAADFWFRYLEPLAYKQLNGPLHVEWETEVFEKFEAPYKREGAGLTLAENYLDEPNPKKQELFRLIQASIIASETYKHDSITKNLKEYHHFFLCNRLFLLNLAAIYTTAFECPDTSRVIPELQKMLESVSEIYTSFDQSFPNQALSSVYWEKYQKAILFVQNQPKDFSQFDHFTFIQKLVNPLYTENQRLIREYNVLSSSNMDFALNKTNKSIFDKDLFQGQNSKGIFYRIKDEAVLSEIDRVGKLLFYDPILSGNNLRSCASCHKPTEFFTDTASSSSLNFDRQTRLPRNSPSLINAGFNHLLMLDGKHISLQNQAKAVVTNKDEMAGLEADVLQKVLSCSGYKQTFKKLLAFTPQEKEITFEHISSAITLYYSKFSNYYSPFDNAMNQKQDLNADAIKGFNLFMGKAQCATCHFVPQFNGVKPPYVGSEFEVIGVPSLHDAKKLSEDKGRFGVNPAHETLHAFRTGSIRNAQYTKPYMHNGVFKTLKEVIDFYDVGGGQGLGLTVENQTLSSDSLHLSVEEKENLIQFIQSLNEEVMFEKAPQNLPVSNDKALNDRKVGGFY
jgi:cytochrome c peroxidase